MKKCLIICLVLLNTICACGQKNQSNVFDETAKQDIMYGLATLDIFSHQLFAEWYNSEFDNYNPKPHILDSLKSVSQDYKIQIILGTWCKDSRREVPRFIKLLNEISYPIEQLEIIGVNRRKVCPEANINEGYVDFVPTFIVFKGQREVGRIIEQPNISFEDDLLAILSTIN